MTNKQFRFRKKYIGFLIGLVPAVAFMGLVSGRGTNIAGAHALPDPASVSNPFTAPISQAPNQVTFGKTFSPDVIGPGSVTTLKFDIINSDPSIPASDMQFTDVLPANVVIATPSNAGTDCEGALLSAPDGGSTVSFSEGGLGPNSSCTVSVDVSSASPGTHMNVSGDLTSSAGNSGSASDDLVVDADLPGFGKSFTPSQINFGGTSRLIFSIDNSANASAADFLGFTDILPAGMAVSSSPTASTDCVSPFYPPTLMADPGSSTISLNFGYVGAFSTCTVGVDVAATAAGVLGNTSGQLSSNLGVSGSASAVLTVELEFLNKAFVDDPVAAGGQVTLEFMVTNFDRENSATDIAFTDNLDAALSGLTAVGLPQANPCGAGSQLSGTSQLSLSDGSLSAESSCTFTVTLQVPSAAASGIYTNTTSSVTAVIAGQGVTKDPASDSLSVLPIPTLSKTFIDDPVPSGGSVIMRFTITNTDVISSATDIGFTDNLDEMLPGLVVNPPADGFCGAGSNFSVGGFPPLWIMTGGSLPAGASCTFDVILDLPDDVPGGAYPNLTSVISAIVGSTPVSGSPAGDDLQVVGAPRLTKSFTDDPVPAGAVATLEFTLSHRQNELGEAIQIEFTDDLAASLPGLAATGLPLNDVCGIGSQISGSSSLSFTGGSLLPAESCTFSVPVAVPASAVPGNYLNSTSVITATVLGLETSSPSAADLLQIEGLSLEKSFTNDPVVPGASVTLAFTLSNTSLFSSTTSMAFTDNLDAALSGLTATGLPLNDICGTGSQISGTSFLSFTGGSLAPQSTCTFTMTLQVPPAASVGDYLNTTSPLSADYGAVPIVVDPATDGLAVSTELLSLTKSFLDDPVFPGGTVTLEFMVGNLAGSSDLNIIEFTDDLSAALPGLAAVGLPLNGICGAGSQISGTSLLTFTGGILSPGEFCTFSVPIVVPSGVPFGTTVNNLTSQVEGSAGGTMVTGPPASDELHLDFFVFTKAFENPGVSGQPMTITFSIENLDPTATADQISFSDNLDSVLTGLVATGLPASGVCGPNSQVAGTSFLSLTNGELGPGASCTFSVTLQIPSAASPGAYLNVTSDLASAGVPVSGPATDVLTVTPMVYLPVVARNAPPAQSAAENDLLGEAEALELLLVQPGGRQAGWIRKMLRKPALWSWLGPG